MLLLSLVNCAVFSRDEPFLANRAVESLNLAQKTFLDVVLVGPPVTDETLFAILASIRVHFVVIFRVSFQHSFVLECGITFGAFFVSSLS